MTDDTRERTPEPCASGGTGEAFAEVPTTHPGPSCPSRCLLAAAQCTWPLPLCASIVDSSSRNGFSCRGSPQRQLQRRSQHAQLTTRETSNRDRGWSSSQVYACRQE